MPWHVAHTIANICWACDGSPPVRGRLGPDSGLALGEPEVGGGGWLFLPHAPSARGPRTRIAIARLRMTGAYCAATAGRLRPGAASRRNPAVAATCAATRSTR